VRGSVELVRFVDSVIRTDEHAIGIGLQNRTECGNNRGIGLQNQYAKGIKSKRVTLLSASAVRSVARAPTTLRDEDPTFNCQLEFE
jgi:hypothetical protein